MALLLADRLPVAEPTDPNAIIQQVELALSALEGRLLGLVRDSAADTEPLDDVILSLDRLVAEIRVHYDRARDLTGRRDLSFENETSVDTLRRRSLWLYRKCRLERILLRKLQVERSLREALFRQVMDAWQELTSLADEERALSAFDEDALSKDLAAGVEAETELGPPAGRDLSEKF